MPSWHFDEEESSWKSLTFPPDAPLPQSPARPSLKMVTYNVLFDKYDAAKICTAERIPQIFSLLSECHADVICLQEVTGAWLRLLLKQQFVRKSFWASDGPECLTLQEYGQVILSRLPFRASVMQFSRMKMCVVAELQFGAHSLGVAAVHLSSNYFDGGADGTSGVTAGPFQEKREKQLGVVVERLQRSELCVIAGDFNYDPKRDACPDPADFSDADDTDSITFDAVKNPTAAVTSKSGKQRRYDRVLFRGPAMRSVECSLLGTAAVVQTSSGRLLCPSDHFGVVARLALPCAVQRFAGVEQLLLAQKSHLGTAEGEVERRKEAAWYLGGVLGCELQIVGSTALGCVLKDSDVDVVLPEGVSLAEARARLIARVALETEQGEDEEVRVRVHLEDGLLVELQSFDSHLESHRDVSELLLSWGARRAAFVAALRFLKLWATRAGVYGTVWGYVNGLALAVMITAAARDEDVTSDALVARFFLVYSAWDFAVPVRLGRQVYQARQHDHVPVAAPSSGRSICRNATTSSRNVLRTILTEAAQIAPDLSLLLLQRRDRTGAPLFFEAHPHYLCIEMPSPRLGLARLIQLVLFLEKCGVECTPYSQLLCSVSSSALAVQLVGLSQAPPSCAHLVPAGCVVRHVTGPVTAAVCSRKRFRFAAETAAPAPEPHNNEEQQPQQQQPDEPVDFAARVAGMSSDKIFAAVRWDPCWKTGVTEILWEDRFLGFIRKPVAQFHPSAIPWHRVRAFYQDNKLIWWRGDMADFEKPAK